MTTEDPRGWPHINPVALEGLIADLNATRAENARLRRVVEAVTALRDQAERMGAPYSVDIEELSDALADGGSQ